jgi:hypothetical protein
VLDDFRGEGLEVAKLNPWLGYGRALHLVREMGIKNRVLDLLDERPLTKGEYKNVCSIIFGQGAMYLAPDPLTDWMAFLIHVETLLNEERKQWVSGYPIVTCWLPDVVPHRLLINSSFTGPNHPKLSALG